MPTLTGGSTTGGSLTGGSITGGSFTGGLKLEGQPVSEGFDLQ